LVANQWWLVCPKDRLLSYPCPAALCRYVRNATLLKAIFDDLGEPPSLGELSDRGAWLAWAEKHRLEIARPRTAPPFPTPAAEATDLEAAHEALLVLTAQAKAASDAHQVRRLRCP
jgi:hypothetical protein